MLLLAGPQKKVRLWGWTSCKASSRKEPFCITELNNDFIDDYGLLNHLVANLQKCTAHESLHLLLPILFTISVWLGVALAVHLGIL